MAVGMSSGLMLAAVPFRQPGELPPERVSALEHAQFPEIVMQSAESSGLRPLFFAAR